MPTEPSVQAEIHDVIAEVFSVYGLEVLEWRSVPTDNADLGATALDSEPEVAQLFVAPVEGAGLAERFTSEETRPRRRRPGDPRLRSRAVRRARDRERGVRHRRRRPVLRLLARPPARRVQGLLKGSQLAGYYPDLTDERFASHVALVHARFSTNTLGAWHLAHPYRNIVHNGEFNTIRGNVNWMRAPRERPRSPGVRCGTRHDQAGDRRSQPIGHRERRQRGRAPLAGRPRPPAHPRMLIPEAFRDDDLMEQARADFYDYHASLVEPWDGPALVIGFDGDRVAGVLDRNGLRPCRYEVTEDNRLVVGSEVGALPTEPADVRRRGRLQPVRSSSPTPSRGGSSPTTRVSTTSPTRSTASGSPSGRSPSTRSSKRTMSPPGSSQNPTIATTPAKTATPSPPCEPTKPRSATPPTRWTISSNRWRDGKDPVGSMGDDTRCRCSPMSTARCSPTSNSCSRRCRTRRSTIYPRGARHLAGDPDRQPAQPAGRDARTRRADRLRHPRAHRRGDGRAARTPWPGRTRAGRQKGRRAGRVVVHLGSRRRDVRPRRVAGRRGESNP